MGYSNVFAVLFICLRGTFGYPGWRGNTLVLGNAVQFRQETWEANLGKPNATGSVPVTGFDITQKWPGQKVDGWMLSVNVSSDIPDFQTMRNTTSGKTFTGTSVFLKAPDAIANRVTADPGLIDDTTWKICITFIMSGPADDAAASNNGNCSFLSSDCITNLQNVYADRFTRNLDCFASVSIPPSCGDTVNKANLTTIQYPLGYLNGTELLVTASEAHNWRNDIAWGSAVKQVWPVLTVWGWNVRATVPDGTKPVAQLSCIRAKSVQPGSDEPSSAFSFRGSAIVAFFIAAWVAFLLL